MSKEQLLDLKPLQVLLGEYKAFTVCRRTHDKLGKARYVLAEVENTWLYCKQVLPYSFAWDEASQSMRDTKGNMLPGCDTTPIVIAEQEYHGRDRIHLQFVLSEDELEDLLHLGAREGAEAVAQLSNHLCGIVRLAPTRHSAWASALSVMGITLSAVQIASLDRAFGYFSQKAEQGYPEESVVARLLQKP